MNKVYRYRGDFGLSCATITVRKDGTAILSVSVAGKRHKSEHKNLKAARAAWYRWNN